MDRCGDRINNYEIRGKSESPRSGISNSSECADNQTADLKRRPLGAEASGPQLSAKTAGEKTKRPNSLGNLAPSLKFWSGREDLNLRPLGPEPSALPG